MYKRGKHWIVVSAVALGGVAMLSTSTVVDAETTIATESQISKRDDSEEGSDSLESFESMLELGTDEILDHGKDGTSNYVISKEGTLYLSPGELSAKDTKDIGKKYKSRITKIEGTSFTGSNYKIKMPVDSSSLFADNFDKVTSVKFSWTDFSETTNTSLMFANMTSLERIHVDARTGVAVDMQGMFKNDNNLISLDLDTIDTSNATDLSEMFSGVGAIGHLDISRFDMSNVKNSNNMFAGTKLYSLTLGAKNKFSKTDTLPADANQIWRSVGNGSENHPQGNLSFSPNDTNGQSLSKYYDGSGKIGLHTFVRQKIQEPGVLVIETNLGNKIVKNITGTPNSTIQVNVPKIEGFTSNVKTVTALIHEDGTVTTQDEVQYTHNSSTQNPKPEKPQKPSIPNTNHTVKPNKVVNATLTISSNLGNIKVPVSGLVGESKIVSVPQRDGYFADKNTIKAVINADGTITTKESVKYMKIQQAIKKDSLITTFGDKGNVIVYSIKENKLTRSNRMLSPNSSWFSDQQITIDGITYLRIATDEWVKATNGYNYTPVSKSVRTKRLARLFDTHGKLVEDRALQGGSNWFTDKIVIINGNKYYRVATNELVSVTDVN